MKVEIELEDIEILKSKVIIDYKLLDKNWWSDEKISFEIGATITNKFKTAFLSIIKLE
jgi:hypothetical protein